MDLTCKIKLQTNIILKFLDVKSDGEGSGPVLVKVPPPVPQQKSSSVPPPTTRESSPYISATWTAKPSPSNDTKSWKGVLPTNATAETTSDWLSFHRLDS